MESTSEFEEYLKYGKHREYGSIFRAVNPCTVIPVNNAHTRRSESVGIEGLHRLSISPRSGGLIGGRMSAAVVTVRAANDGRSEKELPFGRMIDVLRVILRDLRGATEPGVGEREFM